MEQIVIENRDSMCSMCLCVLYYSYSALTYFLRFELAGTGYLAA